MHMNSLTLNRHGKSSRGQRTALDAVDIDAIRAAGGVALFLHCGWYHGEEGGARPQSTISKIATIPTGSRPPAAARC